MDRLISLNAVLSAIGEWIAHREYDYTNATEYLRNRIKAIPSAEPSRDMESEEIKILQKRSYLEGFHEALKMSVKQEPSGDLISRQAVHEAITRWARSMAVLIALPTREVRPLLDSIHELPSVNPQEPKYCDRNICLKNEYSGIGCKDCEVAKSQEPKTDENIHREREQAYMQGYEDASKKYRQEPKTVLYSGDGYADGYMVYDMAECPNCGREFEDGDETWGCKFCPECGQALDWEDEE